MKITEQHNGNVAAITLAGRLAGWHAATAIDDCFRRRAESANVKTVIVDVSNVQSIDSSGVDALIRAVQLLRDTGGEMRIAGLTRRIRDLVVITRLAMLCDTFETVADAIDGPVRATTSLVDEAPAHASVYTVHA